MEKQTQVPQTQTPKPQARFLVIGRHKFTPVQLRILKKAGLTEEAARIQQVKDINEVVKLAQEKQAGAIVVQALPIPLLAQVLQHAQRANIPVYGFRIQAIATVPLDAKCPEGCDIEVPDPRSGNKRCSRTVALQRLKRVLVEAEDVVKA